MIQRNDVARRALVAWATEARELAWSRTRRRAAAVAAHAFHNRASGERISYAGFAHELVRRLSQWRRWSTCALSVYRMQRYRSARCWRTWRRHWRVRAAIRSRRAAHEICWTLCRAWRRWRRWQLRMALKRAHQVRWTLCRAWGRWQRWRLTMALRPSYLSYSPAHTGVAGVASRSYPCVAMRSSEPHVPPSSRAHPGTSSAGVVLAGTQTLPPHPGAPSSGLVPASATQRWCATPGVSASPSAAQQPATVAPHRPPAHLRLSRPRRVASMDGNSDAGNRSMNRSSDVNPSRVSSSTASQLIKAVAAL